MIKHLSAKKPRFFDQAASLNSQKRHSEKNRQRTTKIAKYALWVLIGLGVVISLWQLPGLWGKIRKPFIQEQGIFANYNNINFIYRTNLLLINRQKDGLKEIGILSIGAKVSNAVLVQLAVDSQVSTKDGLQSLGQLYKEQGKKGVDTLKASLIENLGYPIDGYLLTDEVGSWITKGKGEEIADNLFTIGFFLNLPKTKTFLDQHLRTNLTLKNTYDLVSKINSLTGERFSLVDLKKIKQLAEGELDSRLNLTLVDSLLGKENATIEIINASSFSGLGNTFRNIISNLGGNVLLVQTGALQKHTEIFVFGEAGQNMADRLSNILNVNKKVRRDSQNSLDIKVVIGEDFAKFFEY